MRPVPVRFGESLWALIEDEANRDNVSAAQWIRDAALMRALWEQQRRNVTDGIDVLEVVRNEYRAEDEAFSRVVRDVLRHARSELDATIQKLPRRSARIVRRWYGL